MRTVATALPSEEFDDVLGRVTAALSGFGYRKRVIVARYPDVLDAVWRDRLGAVIRLDSAEVLTLSATSSCWPDDAYNKNGAVDD